MTGEKAPLAAAMEQIVKDAAPLMRASAFRKRRHSFNRTMPDGLIHVVSFWMAPFEPSAWTEVPGLRTRLYGTFRLDFGVYVPEMNRSGVPKTEWVNEYNCQLRRTIGQLMPENDGSDLWWAVDSPDAAGVAIAALQDFGLPWLDLYPSKDAVVAAFEARGPLSLGMSPAGGLDIADLLTALRKPAMARSILEAYVAEPVLPNHAGYLRGYLEARGHADLIERIRTRDA